MQTLLDTLGSSASVVALGYSLLHVIWQGVIVALLLRLALAAIEGRDARLRYAFACAALAAVVVAPVVTWIHLYGKLAAAAVPAAGYVPGGASLPLAAGASAAGAEPGPLQSIMQAIQDAASISAAYVPHAVLLWSLGVTALLLRLVGGWGYVRYLVSQPGGAAPQALTDLVDARGRQLGIRRSVRLHVSARGDGPYTFGWLRPVIMLPATMVTGLAPHHLDAILIHELAHIRRHDFAVSAVQSLAEVLFFYHPVVWWISTQIRVEREHCCDDLAAARVDVATYTRALFKVETLSAAAPRGAPAMALSATRGPLLHRIQRLVSSGGVAGSPARRSGVLLTAFVVIVGVGLLGAACANELDAARDGAARGHQVDAARGGVAPQRFAPTVSIDGVQSIECEKVDDTAKSVNYSLYFEDFRNRRYGEALPHLEWILACAPAFPRSDERNFDRALTAYEALAVAAESDSSRRAFFEKALWVLDTAVPTLQQADATVDPGEWAQRRAEFVEEHRTVLEALDLALIRAPSDTAPDGRAVDVYTRFADVNR